MFFEIFFFFLKMNFFFFLVLSEIFPEICEPWIFAIWIFWFEKIIDEKTENFFLGTIKVGIHEMSKKKKKFDEKKKNNFFFCI
jgi:hypothetical protein